MLSKIKKAVLTAAMGGMILLGCIGVTSASEVPQDLIAKIKAWHQQRLESRANMLQQRVEAGIITPEQKEDAIINGYTVVDPATVISTHMSELIKRNAEELLTRQEVQSLIDKIKDDYPVIVDDVLKVASIGLIQRVLKALLHEKIPLKDMLTILETIADIAEYTKNVDFITEQVRARLSRVITQMYTGGDGVIRLLTFVTQTEQLLLQKSQEQDGVRNLMLNVGEINALIQATSAKAADLLQKGISPVIIIVDPQIRRSVAEIFERFSLDVVTLSHAEIDSSATFEVVGSISIQTEETTN